MENNMQIDNSFISENSVNDYLMETAKWGKFLAIIGYIGMGILVLAGLFIAFGASSINRMAETSAYMPLGALGGFLGLIYIIIAVLYYFPVTYLYKFSTQMKQGLQSNDSLSVAEGFKNLKSLFKFMGIFTIVILSLYALIFFFAIIASVISRGY